MEIARLTHCTYNPSMARARTLPVPPTLPRRRAVAPETGSGPPPAADPAGAAAAAAGRNPARAAAEEACQHQSEARRAWLDHAARLGYTPQPSSAARNKPAASAVGAGHPSWARTAYSVDDWLAYASDPVWQAWKVASDTAFESIHGLIAPQIQRAIARYNLAPTDVLIDELWSKCREKARHALDLFDVQLGFAPSTYVVIWIKSAILRLCSSARPVSLESDLRGVRAAAERAQTAGDSFYDLIDAGISVADLEAYLDGRVTTMEQAGAPERSKRRSGTAPGSGAGSPRPGSGPRARGGGGGSRVSTSGLALRTMREEAKARRTRAEPQRATAGRSSRRRSRASGAETGVEGSGGGGGSAGESD